MNHPSADNLLGAKFSAESSLRITLFVLIYHFIHQTGLSLVFLRLNKKVVVKLHFWWEAAVKKENVKQHLSDCFRKTLTVSGIVFLFVLLVTKASGLQRTRLPAVVTSTGQSFVQSFPMKPKNVWFARISDSDCEILSIIWNNWQKQGSLIIKWVYFRTVFRYFTHQTDCFSIGSHLKGFFSNLLQNVVSFFSA